jgi:surfeit locus 1 family protein
MPRKEVVLAVLATVIAAVCVRLGVWQLARLSERRAANAVVASRFAAPPVDLAGIDSLVPPATRLRLTGEFDFVHEFVLPNRSRDGSPGVNLLTPLRMPGTDVALLVNRGWVYSPDGASVDSARGDLSTPDRRTGYVAWFDSEPVIASTSLPRSDSAAASRWVLRHATLSAVGRLPYPVRPYYVILLPDSALDRPDAPVPLPAPSMSEGPHKSYAIQWFFFAAIALVGTAAVIVSGRRSARPG